MAALVHTGQAHGGEPSPAPTESTKPIASSTQNEAPVGTGPLTLEHDVQTISERLQSAINRATAIQMAREHPEKGQPPKARPSLKRTSPAPAKSEPPHQTNPPGHTEAHWSYTGKGTGPDTWAALKPEYHACASGRRQSPIHIEAAETLRGPAEPLLFDYQPSGGSVVNNGHTIQVDLEGHNTLTVRGSTYRLLQFHFHHPAEEKVNNKGFAMVAHLVHKNAEGQLAVVAVLIDPGAANPLVNKVWTHMPLDVNDRVQAPATRFDLKELLPQDQRYYQFMGSLTTPPCTEGVLWMVMQQPMTVSPEQLALFGKLFPMNARPVQALNGRVVREAL